MAKETDDQGKLEVSVRILGNELIGLKMVVDDFKMKWLVLGVVTIVALGWAGSTFGPALFEMVVTMLSKECKLHQKKLVKHLQHMKKALIIAGKLQLLVPFNNTVLHLVFKNTATRRDERYIG